MILKVTEASKYIGVSINTLKTLANNGRWMKMSEAQDFADTIKDNPDEIIEWCRNEIKEYEKLIKILEKRKEK